MSTSWKHKKVDDVCKRGGHYGSQLIEAPGEDVGLLSLRQALIAFASTYAATGRTKSLETIDQKETCDADEVTQYGRDYFIVYMEAIIHAHHFAELAIKRYLRSKNQLLVLSAGNDVCLLDDLICGKTPDPEKLAKVNTVEFADALKRLKALVDARRIDDNNSRLIVPKHYATLEQLNSLRNRLWHRGTYALHYDALDCFFGRFLLRALFDMTSVYSSAQDYIWKCQIGSSSVSPFDEIEKAYSSDGLPDPIQVAYYKEIARAAYRNPLKRSRLLSQQNDEKIDRAKKVCDLHGKRGELQDVLVCPVCGEETLMRFEESVELISDDDIEPPPEAWIISVVRCELCGFELNRRSMLESGHANVTIAQLFAME